MRINTLLLCAFLCSAALCQEKDTEPVTPGDLPTSSKPLTVLPESSDNQPVLRPPPRPEEMDSPLVKAVCAAFSPPKDAIRLVPDARLWIDKNNRRVIVDGYVAMHEGPLEMFACCYGTKEHESAVAVLSLSRYVHAALLSVAATPGRPVSFRPKFTPPTGDRIAVWVLWKDKDGNRHRKKAQDWICHLGTKKTLKADWVFCGSQWWTDPQTGRDFYTADDGDLICVSNFSSATMDIPIESSKSNEYLAFGACTENMPPRGTPVRLVLTPMDKALNDKSNTGKNPSAIDKSDQESDTVER